MRFGEYVRQLRKSKGLNLSRAASDLGMSPQKLSDIEGGRRFQVKAPLEVLRLMAQVYDHPLTDLIANSEFFKYEKTVIQELLETIEPGMLKIEQKTLDMKVEAQRYTPEMEAMVDALRAQVHEVKLAISLAKSKYMRRQHGSRVSDKTG